MMPGGGEAAVPWVRSPWQGRGPCPGWIRTKASDCSAALYLLPGQTRPGSERWVEIALSGLGDLLAPYEMGVYPLKHSFYPPLLLG